ncbi:hypothetical protein ROJ8625_00241 [Roseivivax jejudonensis]|uniref:Uncharacterized protein n=1 Tax=Roseivivax jejudonensis TaxID=1529041 RepID=A0A1X6Y619_9RHOB|nr:hypothetical protein [Roseivivax jejudonensis]SLN11066.1 hypothetical protein ROJ8625_00241 [Roseivivax jejudonensis]
MKRAASYTLGAAVAAAFSAVAVILLLPLVSDLTMIGALVAGGIYLASHVLRACRLMLLATDILGLSGRSAALMHFATAPLALILPFKTGELFRLYELWRLSGTAVYALIALLIDRMYDSLFLVPVLLVLLSQGGAPTTLTLLTLLIAALPLTIVVIGPKLLTELQRYILVNHNSRRTLSLLQQIDALRVIVARASDVALRRAPELSLLSFLIWLSEFLVCLILVNAVAGQALELLGARLVAPWWDLGVDPVAGPALALVTIALLLPWPLMVFLYLKRRRNEPRRVPAAGRAELRVIP